MGLGSRRPDLPALRMPQGRPSGASAGAGGLPTPSLSAPGFSLPVFPSEDEPHTPLPHTPMSFTEFYPMVMTPTPSTSSFDESVRGLASATSSSFGSETSSFGESLSATSAFGSWSSSSSLADPDSRRTSLSSAASSTFLAGKRDRAEAEAEDDWTEREDGILESFLTKPLHPLSTPYPPATLPPPGALDEITSQVLHFHRPPSPEPSANATPTAEMPGVSASPSVGSLAFAAAANATAPPPATRRYGHARNRSLSNQPWTHSWTSTRRRLFQIARKEAIGGNREDRWKGRTEPAAGTSRSAALACKKTMAVPGGLVTRRPGGGMALQRLGSFAELEIDEATGLAEDAAMEVDLGSSETAPPTSSKGLGQVLRLSTSLQRSSRIPPQMMSNGSEVASVCDLAAKPVSTSGAGRRALGQSARPPSLLQRGRSFTAEDFNTYLSLSMSPASPEAAELEEDVAMDEDTLLEMPPIRASNGHMPSRHDILMASRRHERTSSDTSTIMADDRTLATPSPERLSDGMAPPAITFTQTSPSPDSRMNDLTRSAWSSGSDTSPSEERSDPFINKAAFGPATKHRPAPLMRSFSSDNGMQQGPSAFAEFMGNSRSPEQSQPPVFGSPSSPWGRAIVSPTESSFGNALSLPKPMVKKQRTNMSVDLPPRQNLGIFAQSLDNGLRSPFDDGKTFR